MLAQTDCSDSASEPAAELDPLPDLGGDVAEQRQRFAEAAGAGDEPAELVDQLAGGDDQRSDAGADQRAAQHDERRGEAAHRDRGGDSPATQRPAMMPAKVAA